MENNPVISAKEVAEITGRSLSSAYALLQTLNKELAEKGYITLHGKTSRQYFYERLGLNA